MIFDMDDPVDRAIVELANSGKLKVGIVILGKK